MNLPLRVALILPVLGITACGGGGSGTTGTVTPPTNNVGSGNGSDDGSDDNGDQGPLDHCAASVGVFSNVSMDLGLCYEITDAGVASEIEELGGGFGMTDIDGDGRLELYIAYGQNTSGQLFSFDGVRFNERTGSGINPSGPDLAGYFIDLDGDGFKDFISAQETGLEIFVNDQTGRFDGDTGLINISHDRATFSMAAADYDVDGDLDLFFTHWGTGSINVGQEYLWRNNGAGEFVDLSFRVPVETTVSGNRLLSEYTFTPVFADIDSDGAPDLLLASDFESSQVLLNALGGDVFFDMTTDQISDENGMGNAVTDYDRDGDLDWFVTSIWDPDVESNGSGNRLYENIDGLGTFEDVTEVAGVRAGHWGWGACFADFDNDGHMDIFHTNGHQDQARAKFATDPSVLFMANGDGTFTERATELGVVHTDQGRGVVCADYNDDGRVDIFVANNGKSPTVFRNDHQNDNHYIAIDLVGVDGNPEGIGGRVTVATASGTQMQEVQLGNGYLSHGPATLHFGLGTDDLITSIEVAWPGPGRRTSRVEGIAVDQRLELTHPP